MNPILLWSFFSQSFLFFTNLRFVWKLVRNWSDIKICLESIWVVIESSRQNGGLPSADDTRKLVRAAELIFEKELIHIPGVDDLVLAEQLREIEHNLTTSIQDGRDKRGI